MPKQQTKIRNSKQANKNIEKVNSYKQTFSSPEGKKILIDLMATHHMMGVISSKDPLETAFKDGERSVVLRILKLLNTDLDQLKERIEQYENELAESY